ncbi:MAG: hypothetical protein HYZ50_05545 [Deltaproteobacteria bacterium]|nr:hypothetical protein [Deltaproteobacteria bacterium]
MQIDNYLLEGSVRKTDAQVRIIVQLIDATTGEHLWADGRSVPPTDIFAVQDEIVQKIVTALKVKLTPEEQNIFNHVPTENLEAYDYLLRGWHYYLRYTQEANVQARQMFERAIALDPRYTAAYASLAMTYVVEWLFFQGVQDLQTAKRASALAQKAIALDDSSLASHVALGYVYLHKDQQYKRGIAELGKAASPASKDAEVQRALAEGLNITGRPAQGRAQVSAEEK